MRSGYIHFSGRSRFGNRKTPSLVDLCVQTAIDNVRYLGDVGETDSHLLGRILPHCNVDQLMHIENCTTERDLSPVTDKLWKKFYAAKFGAKSVDEVVTRMEKKKVNFRWRQLYQAKLKLQDEAQKESLERLAQSFKNQNARKQSRQIQICTKVPPAKRSFYGACGSSSSFSNVKSNIMKKAKVEFYNSTEVKNRTAARRTAVQVQRTSSSFSTPKPQNVRGKEPFSSSKFRK